jgi:hypothetical protein
MKSTRYSWQVLLKLKFSGQIFGKSSNIKFNENPSSGSRVVARGQMDGQTDMTKVIVVFLNFEKSSSK